MMIRNVDKNYEEQLAWDMTIPCAECPFRTDVPVEKKGILDSFPAIWTELKGDGHIAHSCHKTDNRVTDGGFVEGYEGPVRHCAGFMLMVKKSEDHIYPSGPMLRAMARGKLDWDKLERTDMVHSLKSLMKAVHKWCNKELGGPLCGK